MRGESVGRIGDVGGGGGPQPGYPPLVMVTRLPQARSAVEMVAKYLLIAGP